MSKLQADLQALPPRWARFCLGIETFLLQHLQVVPKQRPIIVAYSTGLDSTALLFWAACMSGRWNSRIIAAHINHGIRSQSAAEADSARLFCQQLGVDFEYTELTVPAYCQEKKIGLEEGGRILRYDFFRQLQKKYINSLLFVGHHLNDLAEDMLMRLSRGTGWPALAGMSALNEKKDMVRPFLLTPKEELLAFAQATSLTWHEDLTNSDTSFLRNRIRHGVMLQMCQENPSFLQQVKNIWIQADLDRKYWENRLETIEMEANTEEYFLNKKTLKTEAAVRLRLYRKILNNLGAGQVLANNLFILDRLWTMKQTGKIVQFPGEKTATICKKGILFKKNRQKQPGSWYNT